MIVSLFLLGCVWLGGGGGEKIGGAALFSMGPPKLYHPKIGEKTQGKTSHSFLDNCPQPTQTFIIMPSFLFVFFMNFSHALICFFLLFITAIIFYFVLTSFFLSLFWDVAFFFFSFFFFLGRGHDFVLFFFFLLFF